MGPTGQMEHESGGSEYLKENSCPEGVGSAWKSSMINQEGTPWLRALGIWGFAIGLFIELLKGLQWVVSQDYCRLRSRCAASPRGPPDLYVFNHLTPAFYSLRLHNLSHCDRDGS